MTSPIAMTYAYPYAIAGTFDPGRIGSYQTPVIRQTCHWRFGDLEAAGFVAYSAGSLTFRQLSGTVETCENVYSDADLSSLAQYQF